MSFHEILVERIDQLYIHAYFVGIANRTIAATNMNASSSRAHTMVTITFDQITTKGGSVANRLSSTINFVDLAGYLIISKLKE